jgi:hypothetical protein
MISHLELPSDPESEPTQISKKLAADGPDFELPDDCADGPDLDMPYEGAKAPCNPAKRQAPPVMKVMKKPAAVLKKPASNMKKPAASKRPATSTQPAKMKPAPSGKVTSMQKLVDSIPEHSAMPAWL